MFTLKKIQRKLVGKPHWRKTHKVGFRKFYTNQCPCDFDESKHRSKSAHSHMYGGTVRHDNKPEVYFLQRIRLKQYDLALIIKEFNRVKKQNC
jgi:hypothetical protein